MKNLVTPGVYIAEKSAFPNTVVEPATAVTAFIGWTERAEYNGNSLRGKPMRLSSLADFHAYFGGSPIAEHVRFTFSLAESAGAGNAAGETNSPLARRDSTPFAVRADRCRLVQTGEKYGLYLAMLQFFANGGSDCYVVSVGSFMEAITADAIIAGIDALETEPEPTILVVPEAVMLPQEACYRVQQSMLSHCAAIQNRIAILDVWDGYRERSDAPDVVSEFRNGIVSEALSYGAAYFPWLHTQTISPAQMSVINLDTQSRSVLVTLLRAEIVASGADESQRALKETVIMEVLTVADAASAAQLDKALSSFSAVFNTLRTEMARRLNLLPPSASMAGVYAQVDSVRGVWAAPANVGVENAVALAVETSDEGQADLNVSVDGKSVNAIRNFPGRGVLVWGARTLDGNSLDWRHINVRRTCNMIKQAIATAMASLAYEPNDPTTWNSAKSMIANYLQSVWVRGGLAGATAADAFEVNIGIGSSMTADDVASGVMRAVVQVSVTRPAEYIVLTVSQQLQT